MTGGMTYAGSRRHEIAALIAALTGKRAAPIMGRFLGCRSEDYPPVPDGD